MKFYSIVYPFRDLSARQISVSVCIRTGKTEKTVQSYTRFHNNTQKSMSEVPKPVVDLLAENNTDFIFSRTR